MKGINMLDWSMTKNILFGWIGTPLISGVLGIILSYMIL